MLEKGNITARQFTILTFLFTVGTTVLVIPSGLAANTKQDAWIGSIAGVVLNLLIVSLFSAIWSRFPNLNFIGLCEKALGKFFGNIVASFFIFYSFIGSATVLAYVGYFMTTEILIRTPIQFINLLFAIIIILGVRLGIEPIARLGEILFPWVNLLFFIFILSSLPLIKIQNILPIFESGIKPILLDALSVAGTASLPFISLFMLFPHVSFPKKARKGFFLATLAGGIFIIIITFLSITILGPNMTGRQVYPIFSLAKDINIANFFTRVEAIMAGAWLITVYFKVTFYFYSGVVCLAETLKLRDFRFLNLPLGIMLVLFSVVVYPNIGYMQKWDSSIYIPYILTIGLFIPLLLFGMALLREKWNKKKKTLANAKVE